MKRWNSVDSVPYPGDSSTSSATALVDALRSGLAQVRSPGSAAFVPSRIPAPDESRSEAEARLRRLRRRARNTRDEFVRSLLNIVAVHDPHTESHSLRVASCARAIGQELGLQPSAVRTLHRAAILHDLGKIGIPHAILAKEGPLDAEEYRLVQQHAELGAWLVQPVRSLRRELPLILHHHEWYNGKGYPTGLRGEQIPLGARILQAADSIDAMSSPRSYKRAFSRNEIIDELRACRGSQFDPAVADTAVAWLQRAPSLPLSPALDH